MPGLGGEGEVEEGVEEGGGVDGPLHDGDVGLGVDVGDEGVEGSDVGPVGEDVVDVEELEGRAGGLVDEDEEEGDEGEPELGAAQLAGAAAEHLRGEEMRVNDMGSGFEEVESSEFIPLLEKPMLNRSDVKSQMNHVLRWTTCNRSLHRDTFHTASGRNTDLVLLITFLSR